LSQRGKVEGSSNGWTFTIPAKKVYMDNYDRWCR